MTEQDIGERFANAALQFETSSLKLIEVLERAYPQSGQAISTINISAGGITNGLALVSSATAIVLFMILAVWTTVQMSNMQSELRAWIVVMQKQQSITVEKQKG